MCWHCNSILQLLATEMACGPTLDALTTDSVYGGEASTESVTSWYSISQKLDSQHMIQNIFLKTRQC